MGGKNPTFFFQNKTQFLNPQKISSSSQSAARNRATSPQPCRRFNGIIKKCAENLAQDLALFSLCRFCVGGGSSGNPSFLLGNARDTSQFLECSKGNHTEWVSKFGSKHRGLRGPLAIVSVPLK